LSKIIDHDPDERPGRRYSIGKWWLAVWAVVAVIWILQATANGLTWSQIALGFATGLLFGYTVIDIHLLSGGSVRDL